MGLRFSSTEHKVTLFDSVTDWAFGPVFNTEEAAERFLKWAEDQGVKDGDVRALRNPELFKLWERYAQTTEDPYG